ncbi:MAG: BamA/TamA family outer membrane protein [Cyanobacteria bacterium J06632_22]
MRFSPTLLACCTISALAALPAQANPIEPPVEPGVALSPAALLVEPVAVEAPAAAESAAAVSREVSSGAATVQNPASEMGSAVERSPSNADTPIVTVRATPTLAQAEETPQQRLERLRNGIGNPPPPVDVAPEATPDPASPVEPAPEAAEPEDPAEVQVQVAEVVVAGEGGEFLPPELVDVVYDAIELQPGRVTTRSQLQSDINSVFATGFFSDVRALPEDTVLGVRVTFLVDPNPVLTQVDVRDNQVLPESVVEEIFSPQYGTILNLRDFQDGILDLNDWYQENGYVLAQVTAAPQISDDGVVTLIVAEGVIEDIEVRYITTDGDTTDENGNPIGGRTRPFIVTRELETQPGDVFQQSTIEQDLQRVFGLGIFDDIRLSLDPGDEDPRKVKVIVNVAERSTGSVGAAAGFNLTGDVFGSISYQQDNFGGNNQKLRAEVQLSSRDLLFDLSFTDPWIAGDPNRTSYTVNLFNRRSRSLIFDNGPTPVTLANGDVPRVNRFGGGVTFGRPLSENLSASLGLDYQRISTREEGGAIAATDQQGNPLTVSGSGRDDLLTIPLGLVWDYRNDPFVPTSGSLLRLGTEQSIPVGSGSIFFNRLRASYSRYIPVEFTGFGEGAETLAFNVQTGTVIGDLPPYEAFSLGGTNSVRGYEEGDLGSGRSFIQATAEYRFPLFTSFLGGTVFVDAATDLGSGSSVLGDPAGVRGKPGSGFGYGVGVRVNTPLGALRLDYGFNDRGDSRIHFGLGERF